MTNPLKKPLIRYGIIFSLIPIFATYGLGHTLKFIFADTLQSVAEMDVNDPDRIVLPTVKYIFPLAIQSGAVAFIIWFLFMRKTPTCWKGLIAGILTVFLSYPILGFMVGLVDPQDRTMFFSGLMGALTLTMFGNFFTFWLTYPLGAVCGYIIAGRMIKKIASDASAPSVFD